MLDFESIENQLNLDNIQETSETTENSKTSGTDVKNKPIAGTVFFCIQYKNVYRYIHINTANYKKLLKDTLSLRKEMDESEFEEYLFSIDSPKEVHNTSSILEKASKMQNARVIVIFSAFKTELWTLKDGKISQEKELPNIVPQTSLLEKVLINKNLLCEDISKESTASIVSFVEYRRVLESSLNKFPKNEKLSTVQKMKDQSSELYDILYLFSYTKNMNAYKMVKAFEEAYRLINSLKFSFYLAYTQNFFYRCKNDGTKNRTVTETLDALQNREKFVFLLGVYSLFLCNFYTMMIKAFSKADLLPKEKSKAIISILDNKIKKYKQSADKDKYAILDEALKEAENQILEAKENSTTELDQVPW